MELISDNLRVAVCLSGELRYFDNPLVMEGFKTFLEVYNPDIFVSTWNHVGTSMNHQYINPFEQKQIDIDLENRAKRVYSNCKVFEVENYNEWLTSIPKDNYNIAYSDIFNTRTINSYTQLYKIYKANQLKKQYEQDYGIVYDVVIRVRPDSLFIRPLNLSEVDDNVIYDINLAGAHYPNRIYDIFFYGKSKEMDILCDSYLNFKPLVYSSFNNGLCPRDTCRLLYLQAVNSGLLSESTKNRPCDIYRGQTYTEYYDLLKSWGGVN